MYYGIDYIIEVMIVVIVQWPCMGETCRLNLYLLRKSALLLFKLMDLLINTILLYFHWTFITLIEIYI